MSADRKPSGLTLPPGTYTITIAAAEIKPPPELNAGPATVGEVRDGVARRIGVGPESPKVGKLVGADEILYLLPKTQQKFVIKVREIQE